MGCDRSHPPHRSLRGARGFADFAAFPGVYSRFTARLQARGIPVLVGRKSAVQKPDVVPAISPAGGSSAGHCQGAHLRIIADRLILRPEGWPSGLRQRS
jgi:hypothetical protein